jgi:hypothetical protein
MRKIEVSQVLNSIFCLMDFSLFKGLTDQNSITLARKCSKHGEAI